MIYTIQKFRYVSENLKSILIRLENDVCVENDLEDHVELLKTLFVNHKVRFFILKQLIFFFIFHFYLCRLLDLQLIQSTQTCLRL